MLYDDEQQLPLTPHEVAKLENDEAEKRGWVRYEAENQRPNRRKWGNNRINNDHACGKRSEGNEGRLPKTHPTRVEAKAIIIKKRSNTHDAMAQDQLNAANAEFEDMMADANDAMDWREDADLYDDGQYSR